MSIRHALLALLAEGPKYGLQLREEFESRTGEVWPLNVGQVYATLQRLERDGLIAPDGPHDTREKSYRLLAEGRAELQEWLESPSTVGHPRRNDLVVRILVAVTVPDVDVIAVIQRHRRHLIEVMQEYTRLKADADDHLAFLMVADSEIFRAEAAVRWLDACEARLREADVVIPSSQKTEGVVSRDRV
ncbi:transcriptional regulator PadR-like family protein [bacterium BMS3Bbin02]|nr:transcriptional regulator PadR-like family protein [bacterium BMS3Bbin02]